ncbi:hypothetical protein ELH92_31880 (plasmid) [Rhizobium ruizarguesonis]|nr:hypothetical protein ELI17_37285 [Rhizobium ruizarguesonis]TCA34459.1 hypothetical protein E0H66_17620 [Rhizobium leguminosarum bv. viciae]TAY08986.1 hypothetical protein ELH92_31880 [Rhizobium ruizarguesonis]TBC69025.1 hypothetical protein ELH30_33195 [Rhizobium ruizarguesonis]TBC83125.1 hypothetical protein ELH28_10240 [Rhizobium ruizarguesonis]
MHYAAVRCCGLHFIVEICCDRERLGRGACAKVACGFERAKCRSLAGECDIPTLDFAAAKLRAINSG